MQMFGPFIVFVIYLNLPAVLVREYGVPFAAGALIPLLLVIPFCYRVLWLREPIRFPTFVWFATGLLAIHFLSALNAIRPLESLDVVIEWTLEGVFLAFLLVNVIRSRAEVLMTASALITAGAVMGGLVLIQQLTGNTDNSFYGFGQLDSPLGGGDNAQIRLAGTIGETNRFAQIMVVLVPIAFVLGSAYKGKARIGYFVAGFLILGGMSLAFSRGAIVSLLLVAPLALYLRVVRFRHLVLLMLAGVVLIAASPSYLQRVSSIGEVALQAVGLAPVGIRNADGAAQGRITEMKAAAMIFADHPVLGVGPGLAQVYYPRYAAAVGGKVRADNRRSHNLFLQLLAETGIIGAAVFIGLLVLAWTKLVYARIYFADRDRHMWALICALQISVALFLLTSMFLHAAYIRYFWMLLGFCVAASSVRTNPVLANLVQGIIEAVVNRIRPTV